MSSSAARERIVVGGDAVEDELHGERRQYDAHHAGADVHFAFPEARHETAAEAQQDERDAVHGGDGCREHNQAAGVAARLGGEQQDSRNSARA